MISTKSGYQKTERIVDINGNQTDRTFLILGEHSINTACVFPDGSGFEVDGYYIDIPKKWAFIYGF
jgi:hypothetical protein